MFAKIGHVGAGDPHGHADIRGLQGGRIVDAVAGHRHRVALTLQRLDDPELVLGVDARVDRYLPYCPAERLVGHALELRTRDRSSVGGNAEFAGDDGRSLRVIARDHDRTDAGSPGAGDGRLGFRARRVDHADQPEEDEVMFDPLIELVAPIHRH
jgi:hypothetical protein